MKRAEREEYYIKMKRKLTARFTHNPEIAPKQEMESLSEVESSSENSN